MKRLPKILNSCLLLLLLVATSGQAARPPLELEIEGVKGELLENLQEALRLPPELVSGNQVNSRWLRRYSRKIPALVTNNLQPLGYFYSQTQSSIEEPEPGRYLLLVKVDPGKPLLVTSVRIEIDASPEPPAELQKALAQFPLQVGDVLHQDLYEKGKSALVGRALQLGFLDADFSRQQLLVHLGERRAEIFLTLVSGPRYQFGASQISGQGSYSEKFIQRFLSYQQGEVFSQAKLGETQSRLLDADLFDSVLITPRPDLADDQQVPINIELQPAARHQLRPGIGYGTDTGARTSLRYRNLNLLDRGHELKGDLLLAERQQSLVTTYIIPDLSELNSQTQLRVGYDREDNDTYSQSSLFGEIERQKVLGKHLIGSLFLRLFQEDSKIGGEENRSRMLLPGVRLTWRRADNIRLPKDALQLQLELLGSSDALLSDTSLLQLSGNLTRRLPLPRQFSLLLRLRGGTSWLDDPLDDLPATLRFFAGGDHSVRGYRYQSLGPTDADGEVVGGKHLLAANFEIEKRFSENWGAAVFYDVGNAFDNFSDYELEQSAGIGVRRYTSIGPIRVDLARQLGNQKKKYRLHLSMGFGW